MPEIAFNLRGLRTLAVLAVIATAGVAFSLPWIAQHIDNAARTREVRRADAGLTQIDSDALQRLRSVANWDTAMLNLDNRFDFAWAQDTLVSLVGSDVTSRLVAVFDGNDRVVFVREHGRPVTATRQAALRVATAGLIGAIRAREAARNARPHRGSRWAASDWIDDVTTMLIEGRPCLVQASLIGTDKGAVAQTHPHPPVLLYASDLRTYILPDLRDHLLLNGAEITIGASHHQHAYLPLRGIDGQVAATLQWTPEQPGTDLLISALPALLAALFALIAAVIVAYRQGRAGTRALMVSEERAQHIASHDPLTGLPNRSLLQDRLSQALTRAARHGGDVTVLMADLDRFKVVNDTYGHNAGDELIQRIAERLSSICRGSDTCARLGGDEFVIVALECGATQAATLAARVMDALSAPVNLSMVKAQTGVSIGISVSQGGAGDVFELLRQADLALYKAKNQGRGRYAFFEREMDTALRERRALEQDLRAAIAHGALEVHYQPQYDADRLAAVEALVRWTHPQRGSISPVVFVPLAEECGLIQALGQFVLRRAFADSHAWPGVKVAINISATQLSDAGFVDGVRALAAEANVLPGDFELEITEGVLVDDTPQTHKALADIRAAGFGLALDDFGTGYSSLSYLHRFPITKLKIDRSFVMRLPEDAAAGTVVHAIIRMAQALGLDTTGEGVETPAQRSTLAAFGCRLTQGYLTGRPMPAAAIDRLVADQKADQNRAGLEAPPLDPAGVSGPRTLLVAGELQPMESEAS